MRKLTISRTYAENQTYGEAVISDNGQELFKFKTLELPWKGNKKSISCIPAGEYKAKKIISPTFGRCFHILNVEGRSAILIHSGNYAAGIKKDTRGCILVGYKYSDINKDGNLDVVGSKDAMFRLNMILPNDFIIKIN